ncbi:hypothetical protein GCM10027280_48300 [Micromonospora polyrhachis]
MTMRLFNRLASLLLALALLVGGLLIVAETILAGWDRAPAVIDRTGWYDGLTGTRLDDSRTQAVAIGVTALGLLILLSQLRRWTPERLSVTLGDQWHLHRRSVERRLAGVAGEVPGVTSASARIRRRGRGWQPRIRVVGDPSVRPAVEQAVRRELDRIAAPQTAAVDVDLARGGRVR